MLFLASLNDSEFFDKHIKNIKQSYNRYYYKTDVYKNKANEALMYFYNEVKKQADEIYLLKNCNKSIKL